MTRKRTVKETKKMWDLLIPILCVICILPLVVYFAIYSCGYSTYSWYSDNDMLSDFYCYYKSYFLDFVAIFALVILVFRYLIYPEKMKSVKIFLPLAGYGICTIVSTLASKNVAASISGNFESFESCLVLLSYLILCVYTYQLMEEERDYRIILYGILAITMIFVVIGGFQIFHMDLLDFTWMQRLVMSAEAFEAYGGELENTFSGNNVYLTLFNPNYAGIFLSMLFAVFYTLCMTETEKKKKIGYTIGAVLLAILIWYTYSRASLLTMFLVIICFHIWNRKKTDRRKLMRSLCAIVVIAVLLIIADASNGFKYIARMIDANDREPLEEMTTDEEGIHILYDGNSYDLYIEEDEVFVTDGAGAILAQGSEGESMELPIGTDNEMMYILDDTPTLILSFVETTLTFVVEDGTYYYQSSYGKQNSMTAVAHADAHGLEYLGSARVYIWTRVVPLLKEYILIGSGPDTFAEVFPQNDFAGKIVYADNPDAVIEKAHNDYLTKWIQTGMISVLCLVFFYISLLASGRVFWATEQQMDLRYRLGLGTYLACISYIVASFFNDSTIQTSPLFWVFAGIALRSMNHIKGGSSYGRKYEETTGNIFKYFICIAHNICNNAIYRN